MSDFFRIPANPRVLGLGLTTLARLSHHAENTGNDILLMQVMDAVIGRGTLAVDIFRGEYIRLHRESPKEIKQNIRQAAPGLLESIQWPTPDARSSCP